MGCHYQKFVPLSQVFELLGPQHPDQHAQCLVQPLHNIEMQTILYGEPLGCTKVSGDLPHQLVLELGPLVRLQDFWDSMLQQHPEDQGLCHCICPLVF